MYNFTTKVNPKIYNLLNCRIQLPPDTQLKGNDLYASIFLQLLNFKIQVPNVHPSLNERKIYKDQEPNDR